jgi:hypothetical protein
MQVGLYSGNGNGKCRHDALRLPVKLIVFALTGGKGVVYLWGSHNLIQRHRMIRIFKQAYFTVLVILSFLSCKNDNKNSYAIRDFKKSLQPYLTDIVSKGIVGYDTAIRYLKANTTDKELNRLSSSEHPVLRAVAFRAMLARPGFNHFDLLMSHLDDTAIVATDEGEFGIRYATISDDIIHHSKWPNINEKNKTVDKVITEHNYLRSAYTILHKTELPEKYYKYIKEMTQRERPFDEIELALYGLARFKKTEDIIIIKRLLLSNLWRMSRVSFRIMEDFPNNDYTEVLEKYYKEYLYSSICGDPTDNEAKSFFEAVAAYKNNWSAEILSEILNRKPFMPCAEANHLEGFLLPAIWSNECKSYSKMMKQTGPPSIVYGKRTIRPRLEKADGREIIYWSTSF